MDLIQIPLPIVMLAVGMLVAVLLGPTRPGVTSKSLTYPSRVYQQDGRVEVLILPDEASHADEVEFDKALDQLGQNKRGITLIPSMSRLNEKSEMQ